MNEEIIERLIDAGQKVCLAVMPGPYQEFPPRCCKPLGHIARKHESFSTSTIPPVTWEDEDGD